MKTKKLKKNEVVVIRRCITGSKSHGGFIYGKKGTIVKAKDWKDENTCGRGLHGWTEGFTGYYEPLLKGNFQVILVNKKHGYVELGNKVKFKKGKILLNTPDVNEAHLMIRSYYPNIILHFSNQIAGYNANQIAGRESTQTARANSTQKSGAYSNQKAGDYSNQIAGYNANQIAGRESTQTAGAESNQKAGNYSIQKAEYKSTQTSGTCSTQTSGDYSTQTAGAESNQKAGTCSFINNYVYKNRFNIVKPSKNSVVSSININKNIANSFISKKDNITYVIDENCKAVKKYKNTSSSIKTLEEYEIIVFGSNSEGNHIGGLAKTCKDKFGAKEGVSTGMTGQCFAINTMSGKEEIEKGLQLLSKEAYKQSGKIFLLTKIGSGIAGYSTEYIKQLVLNTDLPANVIIPKEYE